MFEATLTRKTAQEKSSSVISNEVFGMLINMAGRQRMLSQRIILNAILDAQGQEAAHEVAQEALSLFRDSHTTLVEGKGEMPGVFFEALRLTYFGPDQCDRKIREFMHLAERVLSPDEVDNHLAPTLLSELGLSATPIVGLLNRITVIYEEEFRRHAHLQKKQHHGMMNNIQDIAKQARIVSVNAQIIAARAGSAGREFSVVATTLSNITGEIDDLVRVALKNSAV
ncbi:MAG TPA: type IV pili methyl-accepting chemotaxis transducer N-terminal domain-containing protein [Methylophilaceae bacterium]|nr:type IV pili methyl-accepting chemotaxis transducer N-terminal domain-containing protein [Methylophilaceae bacterium]